MTAFQAGVNSVSWLLIRFAMVMVPIVLLLNGFTKGDWTQAILFALSVAVGLTPEMLPMIVISTLAKGAVLLSRQKVVVKRLDAIQNFGAMDVLCTDKTGTLTQVKTTAVSTEMPMSAARRAGPSLMPSPMWSTMWPLARSVRTMRSLCIGVSLANSWCCSTARANGSDTGCMCATARASSHLRRNP